MGPLAFPLFIFLIAPCTSLILISASAFSNTLTFIPGLAVISALPLSLTFNSPSKYSFHLSHTSVPFDSTRPLSSFTHSSFTSVPFLALFTSLQNILLFELKSSTSFSPHLSSAWFLPFSPLSSLRFLPLYTSRNSRYICPATTFHTSSSSFSLNPPFPHSTTHSPFLYQAKL